MASSRKAGEVRGAQGGESVEELVEGRIGVAVLVGEALEAVERTVDAMLEDALGAGDPVGELAGDEVAEHVPRPPAVVGHVGGVGPGVVDAAEERAEHVRRPSQQVGGLGQEVGHRPEASRSALMNAVPSTRATVGKAWIVSARTAIGIRGADGEHALVDRLAHAGSGDERADQDALARGRRRSCTWPVDSVV